MPTYVIIATGSSLDEEIRKVFSDQDRCQAAPGVWFVRSPRLTSSEVVRDIGIAAGVRAGIVVTAKYYDGIADRGVVEKLAAWEQQP